ncbi:MAG: energy transducer TonB [Pseudomonadota bacterium]|nr:energy transducer TonB [Pseudomonadota bacterium]
MTGLVRIVAALGVALKAVEPRHWAGLGASVALHLGVLLGWKPEPPPEPQAISFEIALESPDAKAQPVARTKTVAKKSPAKKLAKQRRPKSQKVLAQENAQREPHLLDAAWRGESKAGKDVPALALPDANVLGLPAAIQAATLENAKASGKSRAERANRDAEVAANEGSAGLSEPGVARAGSDSAARGETGLALAPSTSLAANQAINLGTGGAGAQASTAASSLAGASAFVDESQGGLHASASPQAALDAIPGAGTQAADATATAAPSRSESQGVRLAASSAMTGLAALPASAGSIAAAPQAAVLAQGAQQQTTPNLPAGGAGRGGVSAHGLADSQTRSQAAAPTARVAGTRVAAGPERAGQGGATIALAPGEPGSSPRFAVALQAVIASAPGSKPGRASSPGRSGAAVSGEFPSGVSRAVPRAETAAGGSGGASVQLAGSASGAGLAVTPGRVPGLARAGSGEIAAPGQVAAAAILNAAGEAGRAPVVLQATQVAPVQVVRPDSEIQRLDVLAPSNYCPLPLPGHSQPDNRAPQPDRHLAQKPAYALDNPHIDYPVLANIRGVEGRVTVRVEVLASGRPGKMWLKQSSGSGLLDQDAQAQLARWRFEPARKNGQPVSAWIDVPVLYRLSEARQAVRPRN